MADLKIGQRKIGAGYKPLVIAEVGINHEGEMEKAKQMVDDAFSVGCECIKFQCHIIDDEMIPAAKNVIPGNAKESIWDIMSRCALDEKEEFELKHYVESKGMLYLCTPFSRAAVDRLERMNVAAYKIGSGECNNYPLVKYIASKLKPVILSTGMNDLSSIKPSVSILRDAGIPFAIMHCTSIYPTPYSDVHLKAIEQLSVEFPDAVIGFSDHSTGNYACLASIALGANIVEKHFTSDLTWPGPDIEISMNPGALKDLIVGTEAICNALKGKKQILEQEQPTIDFAYACVVSIKDIKKGQAFSMENIWVKRPGTGEIFAKSYEDLIGKTARVDIAENEQIKWVQVNE